MIEKPLVRDVQDIREIRGCSIQEAKRIAERQMLGRAIDMLEFPEDDYVNEMYDEETIEMLRRENRKDFVEELKDILQEVKRLL